MNAANAGTWEGLHGRFLILLLTIIFYEGWFHCRLLLAPDIRHSIGAVHFRESDHETGTGSKTFTFRFAAVKY